MTTSTAATTTTASTTTTSATTTSTTFMTTTFTRTSQLQFSTFKISKNIKEFELEKQKSKVIQKREMLIQVYINQKPNRLLMVVSYCFISIPNILKIPQKLLFWCITASQAT